MRNEPINYKLFHFEDLDQITNLPHDYLSSVNAIQVSPFPSPSHLSIYILSLSLSLSFSLSLSLSLYLSIYLYIYIPPSLPPHFFSSLRLVSVAAVMATLQYGTFRTSH